MVGKLIETLACRNTCDDILADYDNLNSDIAKCAATKQ